MNKTRAHAAEVIIGAMACYYTLLTLFFYRNDYYTSRQYNEQSLMLAIWSKSLHFYVRSYSLIIPFYVLFFLIVRIVSPGPIYYIFCMLYVTKSR